MTRPGKLTSLAFAVLAGTLLLSTPAKANAGVHSLGHSLGHGLAGTTQDAAKFQKVHFKKRHFKKRHFSNRRFNSHRGFKRGYREFKGDGGYGKRWDKKGVRHYRAYRGAKRHFRRKIRRSYKRFYRDYGRYGY